MFLSSKMEDADIAEIKSIDKNILDLFWKLCEKDLDVRFNACTDILQAVFKKQLEVGNENELSKDLEYCVERLVRGLASPRDAARLGYTLLLTEILKNIPVVQIEKVLELMRKHLTLTGKQDRKDLIFGQLFCYTAIVRSGRLPNHVHLSHVLVSLIDLCHGRSYILNAVYKVMLDIFSQLSSENFKDLWNELKKKLPSDWETSSADSLWLLMLSIRFFSNVIGPKYMKNHWKNEDLFIPENLVHLKKIIKQTTCSLPNLHPTCIEFLLLVKQRSDFRDIWNAVVDDNLFLEQSEKSFVGFEMIKTALQDSPSKKILKTVLSPKFRTFYSKCYLNNKHPLNPAANHLAKFLLDFVKNNAVPDMQITVLKSFLQPPGTVLLDQILRKEEVSQIIQNLLPDAVKTLCEILKSIILKNKSDNIDEKEVFNITHSQALQQITTLIVHPVTLSDLEWRMNVIKFLFLHSFFVIKETTSEILHCEKDCEALSDAMRNSCMSAFYKAINSLHMRINNQQSSLTIFLEQLMNLTEYAETLMNATDNLEPKFSVEKVQSSWGHLKTILHKLQKQSKKDNVVEESNAFMVLFLQLGFHIFQDPENISETLEELYICCKKFLKTHKHGPVDSENDESEPPWIGVIVDILLFLLSKPSHYFRSLVTYVFPLFCPFIDQNALQQILDVINPQKDGEDMLVDENESDAEGEEDAEFESGSSSDESDDNANKQLVDEEFKKKVQQALGAAADDSEAESVVLSDSEMFKLDSALSEVFKSRVKSGHTQIKEEEKTLLHFRVRCLDLIVSYLKSEPPMYLVLMCIEPILSTIEFGHKNKHQQDLLKKAVSVLDLMTKIRKFKHHENVGKSELKRLLDILILRCHKEIDMSISNKLSHLCVFIVLCYRKLTNADSPEKKKTSKIPSYIKSYISALDTFVSSGSSHMFPNFFTHLMEACPDVAKHFIAPCRNYAFNHDIRLFKKTQCLGLLSESLKYSKSQRDITEDEWFDYANNMFPLAVEALKNAVELPDLKPVYVTEILTILYTLNSIIKEKTDQSLLLKYDNLLPVLESINGKKLKKLKSNGVSLRKKLFVSLGGSIEKSKKSEDSIEHSEANTSSQQHKRKSSESNAEAVESNSDKISNGTEVTDQLNSENVQPSIKKQKSEGSSEGTNLIANSSENVPLTKKLKAKKKKKKEKQPTSEISAVTN